MDLWHEKHSELKVSGKDIIYKGRVVFRGDQTKDETGSFAVFTEQAASASHMAAAKFLDAIARFPGCSGEDSDAIKAHTQVKLDNLSELLGNVGGKSVQPETWISLPRNRRPKHWDSVDQPVVKLLCNLYGHPSAGLIWEKFCHRAVEAAHVQPN